MTHQLPDDMFIENSTLPAQLAAGNAMPQPGIIVDGEGAPPRVAKPRNTGLIFFVVFLSLLIAAGGALAFVAVDPLGESAAPGSDVAPGEVAPAGSQASPEDLYDKYIAMSNDESIFLIIPRTDEGWDYFRAFMYKITDYKVAEQIGGALDAETTAEMLALEKRFLALEDLELTVDITRTDGTRFVHDGKPPTPVEPSATP